ncbi:hypothetical protein ACLWBD_05390 [Bdellovibrio sp. HCB117]|uniref:hypothetical protein n=1 Tax=Bdellovibrio sp. HCB117 TaxID=3394359 RepID=UPI0039B4C037
MEEVIKSALDNAKARIVDPIFGSYSILFFVVNWRIVLTVFSDKNVDQKIQETERLLTSPLFKVDLPYLEIVSYPFIFPVLLTCFYIALSAALLPIYKLIEFIRVYRSNAAVDASSRLRSIENEMAHLRSMYSQEFDKRNRIEEVATAREATISSQAKTIQSLEEKISGIDGSVKTVEPVNQFNKAMHDQFKDYLVPIESHVIQNNINSEEALRAYYGTANRIFNMLLQMRPKSVSLREASKNFGHFLETGNINILRNIIQSLKNDFSEQKVVHEVKLTTTYLLTILEYIEAFHK